MYKFITVIFIVLMTAGCSTVPSEFREAREAPSEVVASCPVLKESTVSAEHYNMCRAAVMDQFEKPATAPRINLPMPLFR